ncbi:hypothetical protein [Paenibacillus tuaregi]|uniref:hypothetical protein n=1 Tax=Paenibacillus tuaregi TaxID=1816681 RepID=UPI000A6BF7C0|nr:hypothetical protein [Paenibacillus tuaregi]
MKILNALIAAYWSVLFFAYIFGIYDPDGIIVGFALFFCAVVFADIAFEEARE